MSAALVSGCLRLESPLTPVEFATNEAELFAAPNHDAVQAELNHAEMLNHLLMPLQLRIRRELYSLSQSPSPGVPLRCLRYCYSLGVNESTGGQVLYRGNECGGEHNSTALDLLSLQSALKGTIEAVRVSPGEDWAAVNLVTSLGRSIVIVNTGGQFQAITAGPKNAYDFAWDHTGRSLIFTSSIGTKIVSLERFDIESGISSVLLEADSGNFITIKRSTSGKYLFIAERLGARRRWSILDLQSDDGKPQLAVLKGFEILDFDHSGTSIKAVGYLPADDKFMILHLSPSLNYLIRKTAVSAELGIPQSITSYREYSVISANGPGGTRLIVESAVDGTLHTIVPDGGPGVIKPAASCDEAQNYFYYTFSSPVKPPAVYRYSTKQRASVSVSRGTFQGELQPGPQTASRMDKAVAQDGTSIPMSVFGDHRKTLLIAYGAYGKPLEPAYERWLIPLLKRGYSAVYCHVRGGGELGPLWHSSATNTNKRVSVDDYIACAQHLRAKGLMIAAYGRSAGAVTVARAILDKPALFKAAVLEAPFLDVLGQMSNLDLSLTPNELSEWGDPRIPAERRAIEDYTPFRITAGELPHLLVTRSLHDELIPLEETLGWVKAVRRSRTNRSTLALRLSKSGGHFGESKDYREIEEHAFKVAFIIWSMR